MYLQNILGLLYVTNTEKVYMLILWINVMIISASRRTDIPSYYGQWFVNRLQDGHVFIPSPYAHERYSKAMLGRENVDIIVFWTKNPRPFLSHLRTIDALGYPYYFQYTLTPYDKSTEKNLPSKAALMQTFMDMSILLGKNRVIWRYDPIIISHKYTLAYHAKAFAYMAAILAKYTTRCIISFVDDYNNLLRREEKNMPSSMTLDTMYQVAEVLSGIAQKYNLPLYSCSERVDLRPYAIHHGACIDKNIIEDILHKSVLVGKDKNQRKDCLCVESIDIGTYNCCANGCTYCYALHSEQSARANMIRHNPNASVLIGTMPEDVLITKRKHTSVIGDRQCTLL